MLSVFVPQIMLFLAFLGAGYAVFSIFGLNRLISSKIEILLISYFLGQGVLGILFTLLGLEGLLRLAWILIIIIPCALYGVFTIYRNARTLQSLGQKIRESYKKTEIPWKIFFIFLFLMILAGFTSLGAWLSVDALAFYFPYPKLLVSTGKYLIHPYSDYIKLTQIGLLAETFIAVLGILGNPGTSMKLFAYVNFLPALALLCILAVKLGMGKKGIALLVSLILTSSVIVYNYSTGKVSLYAIGPALTAVLFAFYVQQHSDYFRRDNIKNRCLFFSGFFSGLSVVFQLSYLPLMVIILFIYLGLPVFNRIIQFLRNKERRLAKLLFVSSLQYLFYFFLGLLSGLFPLFVKNQALFGSWFGVTGLGAFFTIKTALKIMLAYPVSAVFGRYAGASGNLSVLFLISIMFTLFYFGRVLKKRNLILLTAAAVFGFLGFCLLFPTYVINIRYYFIVIFLIGMSLCDGFAAAAEKNKIFNVFVPIAASCVIAMSCYFFIDTWRCFRPRASYNFLLTHKTDEEKEPFAQAAALINSLAKEGEGVYSLCSFSYWLRVDLIQSLSRKDGLPIPSDDIFNVAAWFNELKNRKIFYILWDRETHAHVPLDQVLKQAPDWVNVIEHESFGNGHYSVYELTYTEAL
jgi:hypothetical protein